MPSLWDNEMVMNQARLRGYFTREIHVPVARLSEATRAVFDQLYAEGVDVLTAPAADVAGELAMRIEDWLGYRGEHLHEAMNMDWYPRWGELVRAAFDKARRLAKADG